MVCARDRNGYFPLQISIRSQQRFSATKLIYDTYPCIGRESDLNGFLSFQLAAIGDWDNDIDQINSIFYSIVQDPMVLKC